MSTRILSCDNRRFPRLALASALAIAVLCSVGAHAAWAVTPKEGRYAGEIGAFSISFRVSHGKVTHIISDFQATLCTGLAPSSEEVFVEFPTLRLRNGHFSGSITSGHPPGLQSRFSISGTFRTPTRAAGPFDEHISVPANWGLPQCNESRAFTAARVGA